MMLRSALRRPTGAVGATGLVALVILAVVGPAIWGDVAVEPNPSAVNGASGADHWFGTDALGRDVFARTMVATRLSLLLAVASTALGVVVGIPIGALPAVLGPRVGRLVSTVINMTVAFPGLLLAMYLTVVVGLGPQGAVLGIGLAIAPGFARLTQTLAASVAGSDYVAAAAVLGVPRRRRLTHYVLPNIAEPLILNITITLGAALLAQAGLSFLGLGVQPPDYDWGRLVGEGLPGIYVTPLSALGPAGAVVFAAMAFTIFGEGLAHAARHPATQRAPRKLPAQRPAETVAAPAEPAADTVLAVKGLRVTFPGPVSPVRDVSFTVRRGEIVGVVGESGSGKSLTSLAIAGLVPYPATVDAGVLRIAGTDPRTLTAPARRRFLGTRLAMVLQDPSSALNPALKVGTQLAEVLTTHQRSPRPAAWASALDRLRQVAIGEPARRARQYPHEFSGGMRQRAVIAMGLMAEPSLIIADEPTTALDVTVQRQILRLLKEVTVEGSQRGAVLISHDLAVVAQVCSRVVIMYAGRVVEEAPVAVIRGGKPAHPYTKALLDSAPDLHTDRDQPLATIAGEPPDPRSIPDGCAFAPRCPYAADLCRTQDPALTGDGTSRVACHFPLAVAVSA